MSGTKTAVGLGWPTRYWVLICGIFKSRSVYELALTVLPIFAKLRLTTPTAILVYLTIRPLSPAPRGTERPVRVLILEKSIFNDDALLSLGQSERVQVFGLARSIVKAMAVGVLPREICNDNQYKSEKPEVIQRQRAYRAFMKSVWRRISLVARFDAVLSGNWAYYAEREFAGALEDMGIPFIVLYKEGLKPPGLSYLLADFFHKTRGNFTGRRVLTYHETEREHLLAAKTTTEDRITVVGMPRLDRIHEWRRSAVNDQSSWCSEAPSVVFFALTAIKILPVVWDIDSDLRWNELTRLTYGAILRFAHKNPSIKVIVRPKISEVDAVQQALDEAGPRPQNLSLNGEGDVFDVIRRSWVVCGHNTTALFEAIAAGKPIVVPHYAEAVDPRYESFVVDVEGGVEYADSPQDLIRRLEFHVRTRRAPRAELSKQEKRVLKKWTGNADGAAGRRVTEAVLAEIDKGREPSLRRAAELRLSHRDG